jgi:hypothetical protein
LVELVSTFATSVVEKTMAVDKKATADEGEAME